MEILKVHFLNFVKTNTIYYKINLKFGMLKEDDNILISSATHSPWIRDKNLNYFTVKLKT